MGVGVQQHAPVPLPTRIDPVLIYRRLGGPQDSIREPATSWPVATPTTLPRLIYE